MSQVPLVELHAHIKGAATPAFTNALAQRNRVDLPSDLYDIERNVYSYTGFHHFLECYHYAGTVFRTPADYREITFDYLMNAAAQGAIYCEIMCSPDHAARQGVGYEALVDAIGAGILDARERGGIEACIVITAIRHHGPADALTLADLLKWSPHPLVRGFGLAGNEHMYNPADFAPAFRLAADAGLGCTAHVGEFRGAESVQEALSHLPLNRIGHGVSASADARVLAELSSRRVGVEVCLTSNICTGAVDPRTPHPLPLFLEAGCLLSINTDDPAYFNTSLGEEYRLAARLLGSDERSMAKFSLSALESAFCDSETKRRLRAKVESFLALRELSS